MSIPEIEPAKITAGDYVQWKRLGSGILTPAGDPCPASDGWALTYAAARRGLLIKITAAASGDDHLVTLAAATTAAYKAGIYDWQAYITKSSERYMVGTGTIEIFENLAAATTGHDGRSHVKKVLDALEDRLVGRADNQQSDILLGGQTIGMMPIQQVLAWRDKYRMYYEQEQRAEAVKKGLGHSGNIYVRFTDA